MALAKRLGRRRRPSRADATATFARRARCSARRRRSARPATTAATWRWRRARRAPIMSRSALSTRRRPSRRIIGPQPSILSWWSTLFEIPCVAIGGITPDNAQAAGRCRRRFHRGLPGGVGQGRSAAAVQAFAEVLAGLDERPLAVPFGDDVFAPASTGMPSCRVHGFGLPSSAMLFQIEDAPELRRGLEVEKLEPRSRRRASGSLSRSSRSRCAGPPCGSYSLPIGLVDVEEVGVLAEALAVW